MGAQGRVWGYEHWDGSVGMQLWGWEHGDRSVGMRAFGRESRDLEPVKNMTSYFVNVNKKLKYDVIFC